MQKVKKDLLFSNNAKFVVRNKHVVAMNQLHGGWLRFSEECYQYLNQAIDLGLTKNEFLNCFEEKDDQLYMQKLLNNLESIKVIVNFVEKEREKEPNLDSVQITITNRCNLNCKHCATNAMNRDIIDDVLDKTDVLSTDDIKKIIDKIVACRSKSIVLTGGEPLIRKDFMDIVHYIKEKDKNVEITVMTNATLLTEQMIPDFVKYISAVDISLDGYDEESCSSIRGKNVFRKVLKNIELLQRNGLEKISVSMVSLGKDQEGEKRFNELCKKLNVTPMIRRLTFLGRAKENEEYLINNEKKQADVNIMIPSIEEYRSVMKACSCRAGIEMFNINERGDIYPCSTFDNDMDSIGNIMEIESLHEFIKDQKNELCENKMKFYKYIPYYEIICNECSVRYFCWTCPYAAMEMIEKTDSFSTYCDGKKEFLHQVVWGEEWVREAVPVK